MAGSRARRRRRLRLPESPEIDPTHELRDTDTPATTDTSAWQPPQPRDDRSKKKKKRRRERSTAAKDRSEEARRARVDEWISGGDEEKEDTDQAKKKDDVAEEEEKMKDDADVAAEEEDDDEVVSSAPSSPIRAPVRPDEHRPYRNPAYDEAFARAEARYKEKTARQMKLPTLDQYKPRGRRVEKLKPISIRESERKTVLRAAKFVVGVSSSVGGEPRRCSGFWIDWDEDKKTGIVLTIAELLRTNCYSKQEYVRDAEVIVHLRDDTTAEAHLLYYQPHYNLALFGVTVDQHVQLPSFSDELHCDQEVFELGRDEHLYLRIGPGRVQYKHYNYAGGYHCMGVLGGHEDFEHEDGGPVIDFDGNVVGMVMCGSFIPSSVLLKCLHLWRKYRCIPRPPLGLELSAIKVLDLSIVEKISVKCNIDEGLIVKEVSKGSHAEKLGIRVGDLIECLNGECIGNTVELENILLSACEGHLDKGNDINSKVDISIKVFHTRKGRRSIKTLTTNLSECREVVRRVYYPFTIGEGFSASESPDEVSSD